MDALTESQQFLARWIFQIGAFQIGAFRLKHHQTHPDAELSPFKINLRTPENPNPGPLTPELEYAIGEQLYQLACERHLSYDHVVGVPHAGDPFAKAFAQHSGDRLSVLRLGKEGGPENRRIGRVRKGVYSAGDKVLLLDDLVAKAGSKLEATEALKQEKLRVRDIVVLVDREQGGIEKLAANGYKCHAAFRISAMLAFYLQEGMINVENHKRITAYLAANR